MKCFMWIQVLFGLIKVTFLFPVSKFADDTCMLAIGKTKNNTHHSQLLVKHLIGYPVMFLTFYPNAFDQRFFKLGLNIDSYNTNSCLYHKMIMN